MRVAWTAVLCLQAAIATAQPLQPVQILHQFTAAPSWPNGGPVLVPDGSLYGVTIDAIYRIAPDGQVSIAGRITDGTFAEGTLVRGPDGGLYGSTQSGGSGGKGTIFRFDPVTGVVRTLHAFDGVSLLNPIEGGVTFAGGLLYAVRPGALVRIDPATGATETFYISFNPGGPLTLGNDGHLYGVSTGGPGTGADFGAIYRVDPASPSTASVLHAFATSAYAQGPLRLGPDNRLYGGARGTGLGPGGAVYRYDPGSDAFEVLHQFAAAGTVAGPGSVVVGPDGSLYGTMATSNQIVPSVAAVLFRLRPSGGGYVHETLHTFDPATTGASSSAELALGADGLIYGYSQSGGTAGNGTLYRFDPASNPVTVSVLHAFAPATTWGPSAPALGPDGLLHGTASRGGAAQRGAVYTLNPATGAVTIPGAVPGSTTGTSTGWNSALAVGGDDALYGTSAMATTTNLEHGIVRFVPATGAVTTVPVAATPHSGSARPGVQPPLTRAPSGDMYFVSGRGVLRFVPATSTLTTSDEVPDVIPAGSSGNNAATPLVTATDGGVYFVIATSFFTPPYSFGHVVRFMRIDPGSGTVSLVSTLANDVAYGAGLVQGTDGALYLGGSGNGSQVRRLEPATGASQLVCTLPETGLRFLSVAPDGRLVGVMLTPDRPQRLFVCNPSTGAVEVRLLPHSIGTIAAPLVAAGGALYGATWGQPVAPLVPRNGPAPVQPGGALIRLVLDGPPPPIDTDGDGLPPEWETAFGLDPTSADGDDGADGDPDGDGLTNAEEFAAGTHPRGHLRRFFAEGATGAFFRTRLDIANPNGASTATVRVAFLTDAGGRVVHDLLVRPLTRVSIDPSTLAPLASAAFSTVVESDAVIAVDRVMSWDASGYGSHIETGLTAPSTTWYLAEGSTSGPFSLFYLLQNPQPVPVTATVRYLRPSGLPPIERTYALLPHSRRTIVVDGEGIDLANTDVSAVITADGAIVAERAMYYSQPGQAFAAGHASAGVTAPALEWFFAEGATGAFFDLFLLLANPGTTTATVDIEYLLPGGGSMTRSYAVPGQSRVTIWVDDEELPVGSGIKPLANTALSATVRSTNQVPIIAERTMWWPGPALTPTFWYEAHNSPGATASALRWVVAGGDLAGPAQAQTYVLIANPGSMEGRALVTLLDATRGQLIADVVLPPRSRTNVAFPSSGTFNRSGPFSWLVESTGAPPVPIVVEHATYSSPGGVLWGSGGNALAAPIP